LEARHHTSKGFSISLFSDFPDCNGEDFHEEVDMTIMFCISDGVKELEIVIPADCHIIPALTTEGALEDEVVGQFFYIEVAEHTTVVISFNFVVLPSEKVSRVYSVSKEQPYKDFDFS
jgi:hypothetical protein